MACLRLKHAGWHALPEHMVLQIYSCLSRNDQFRAALTCKHWYNQFIDPSNWRHYSFDFKKPNDQRHTLCIISYGQHLKSVRIDVDQFQAQNRQMACYTIRALAQIPVRNLEKFILNCVGRNPLFYAGIEFVNALLELFGQPQDHVKFVKSLKYVDLSGLPYLYDNTLFDALAAHHPYLEYLNIQNIRNSPLVCKVTPACILKLVTVCRNLKDLRVINCSLSNEVLHAFSENNRDPLQHLAITCRKEEHNSQDLSSVAWRELVQHVPDLRVSLRFDHTCPLHKISQFLKPEIPCSVLKLETFTFIHDEIKLAYTNYNRTLEKLIVQTRPSKELNDALVALSDSCPKLKSLHIFCVLDKDTIQSILEKHPHMRFGGKCTLKYEGQSFGQNGEIEFEECFG